MLATEFPRLSRLRPTAASGRALVRIVVIVIILLVITYCLVLVGLDDLVTLTAIAAVVNAAVITDQHLVAPPAAQVRQSRESIM